METVFGHHNYRARGARDFARRRTDCVDHQSSFARAGVLLSGTRRPFRKEVSVHQVSDNAGECWNSGTRRAFGGPHFLEPTDDKIGYDRLRVSFHLAALLRACGLDELPQILNVLKGEMSLVGPRPCVPYEFEKYLPRHRGRCATLPGLTGLWQVSGKNRTTFEEMIDLDLDYCRKKSLWMDVKIIAMTIPAIFVQVWDTLKRKAAARHAHNESPRGDKRACINQVVIHQWCIGK